MRFSLDDYLRFMDQYPSGYIDYDSEIRAYGNSLSASHRRVASAVFYDYMNRLGLSKRDVFYAIQILNGRSIVEYKNLMFNKGFLEEVTDLAMQSVFQDMDTIECGGMSKELKQMTDAGGYVDFTIISDMHRRLYASSKNYKTTEEKCYEYFKSIVKEYPSQVRNQMYEEVQKLLIEFYDALKEERND